MPDDSNKSTVEMDLKQLKLRPGMLMQIQPTDGSATAVEAQFVAALPGRKGIMIAPHGSERDLTVGAECSIRGFTGQYDFVFSACVLQNFKAPFAYALFTYPDFVDARLVRKALRMKTQLTAIVRPRDQPTPLSVQLIDLSVAGAMLDAPKPIGALGEQVELCFSFEIDSERTIIKLMAKIAHSSEAGDGVKIGVMFDGIAQADKLALQCYVMSLVEEEATTG